MRVGLSGGYGDASTADGESLAATGDGSVAGALAILILAAICAMLACKRSRNVVLSVLLVCGLTGVLSVVPADSAQAQEKNGKAETSCSLSIGDGQAVIGVLVSYGGYPADSGNGDGGGSGSGGSDDEGIVYQDDVIVVEPEHWLSISEDGLTAVVDADTGRTLSRGCVLALLPGNGNHHGTSMRVESVLRDGDSFVVTGAQPEFDEVVKSLRISGTTSDLIDVELAEGVAASNRADGSVSTFTLNSRNVSSGTINIEDYEFEPLPDLTITLSPHVDYSIDYDFLTLNECSVIARVDSNIGYYWNDGIEESVELFRGTYATPVPGLTIDVLFSLEVSLSGEIDINATMVSSAGVEYADGNMNVIADNDLTYDAYLGAEATAGVKPNVQLSLLSVLGIADVSAEVGVGVEAFLAVRNPDLTCADMSAWVYVDLAAGEGDTLLGAAMDLFGIEKVYHPIDRGNSPEWSLHAENGERVPECTWRPEEPDYSNPDVPPIEDNGYGNEPSFVDRGVIMGSILERPFNIEAGTAFTFGAVGAPAPLLSFYMIGGWECTPGTVFLMKYYDTTGVLESEELKTSADGWTMTGTRYPDAPLSIEVLYGRVTITNMQGFGAIPYSVQSAPMVDYPMQISDTRLDMGVGQTGQLNAFMHENLQGYKWVGSETWESSDPSIASVDSSGVVSAVSPGMATISVKWGDVYERKCLIVVS